MPPKGSSAKPAGGKKATPQTSEAPLTPEKPGERSYIVGVGASAGGLAAIEAFLGAMPPSPEKEMAFVIVQHLSPDHKSILTELIRRNTQMPVFEAEDGMTVVPGCVYVIPPNRDLGILRGKLQLIELDPARGVRHPIDFFLRSLATDQNECAVAVVLSGTGTDGTLGIRAIKAEGGLVIAQAPETSDFDGMPRSAISTGLVDYVLAPAAILAQLLAYVGHTISKGGFAPTTSVKEWPDILAKVCILLRTQTGHDFSQYKESTIIRRLERRMAVHQIDRASEYLRYLQQHRPEVSALFRDLLIGVTSFFRDPDAFTALEKLVIPRLVERIPVEQAIRIWVCGCSTGEEAYSIAILLQEHLQQTQQLRKIQIFATDLDRQATDQARSGFFPASIATDVTPERLTHFFTQEANGSFRISKVIRDYLIFSEQDVLKDPPFSRLDLISCRNLLIYLNGDLQKRLVPLFHYALRPEGVLFLGSAEGVGDQNLLFESIDRKARLYRRKMDGFPNPYAITAEPVAMAFESKIAALSAVRAVPARKWNFREITEQTLLNYLGSAAVLINARGEILYFHGRTGQFLEPAPGNASANILTMAREGLSRELAVAIQRAVARREAVSFSELRIAGDARDLTVSLSVVPAELGTDDSKGLLLVVFSERPSATPAAQASAALTGDSGSSLSQEEVGALHAKIRSKDEYIQSIVEEMETSNEELKSFNEEMQSVNEELQSANEELETSREELQSLNEELATVNTELQQKVSDLSRSNNDMNNLLAGTGVGTLFVDNWLRISRFTPSITPILNFIESDVGRPLSHIVNNLINYERLITDVKSVLNTLIPIEVEVQGKNGSWYILSIRPYRTLENIIEGCVITFVDITKLKLAEGALVAADHFRRAAQIETVGIAFLRMNGIVTSANEAFLHMIGCSQEDVEKGSLDWVKLISAESLPSYSSGRSELISKGRTDPFQGEYVRKDGTRGGALFATWRLNDNEMVVYVIGIPVDRSPTP